MTDPTSKREKIHDFVYGDKFTAFITFIIVLNAVLIGMETYDISEQTLRTVKAIENVCLAIYIIEIALKFTYAHSKRDYFLDGWNIFDIIVVGAAFVPAAGSMAPILRVLRVFRILRIIKIIPELRLIVSVLWKSLSSMLYIALLMIIIFYIYAVIGVKFFGESQPENYGTLHEALFSLFRSMTAEDWTDLRYAGLEDGQWFWVTIYHVSWILLSTFLILNLVVGAIINNYNEVQEIEKLKNLDGLERDQKILDLMGELKMLLEKKEIDTRLREKIDDYKDKD